MAVSTEMAAGMRSTPRYYFRTTLAYGGLCGLRKNYQTTDQGMSDHHTEVFVLRINSSVRVRDEAFFLRSVVVRQKRAQPSVP